jgi:predicted alpha/beta-fold hydrolase
MIKQLDFHPFPGLASAHLQTVICAFLHAGVAPPSTSWLVTLDDGDQLCCEISTPNGWNESDKTILLVHGMGGSHESNYMIRIAKKFYVKGIRVVRVNLRGCGSGKSYAKLPYNAGTSSDILAVIRSLNALPSTLFVVGFSLGASLVLKLAGEIGCKAKNLVQKFIAICPPLDLLHTVKLIQQKRHILYHKYYLKRICKQARLWMKGPAASLYEFDDSVTAPLWGYQGATDYYHSCSSVRFLPQIQHPTDILFAEDDPFIQLDYAALSTRSNHVTIYTTKHGGHLGFLSHPGKSNQFFWLDAFLHKLTFK